MPQYKHYSFDLWLTLIKSNPLFKKSRSQYFFENLNFQKRSLAEVEAIFRQVDVMCNTINERTGKNIDADEMYLMVISQINNNLINLHNIDIDGLYQTMEALLFDYPPQLYCNDTASILRQLKEAGATINILSNTGFIKGATLRRVLQLLGIGQYFDFQLYSDEAGCSKPNPEFFKLMTGQAMILNPELVLSDILHTGDNPIADIEGAQRIGLAAMLVNSNQTSITNLTSYEAQHIFPS